MLVSHLFNTSKLVEENRFTGSSRLPVIWFEVEDLLRYFDHFPNPTGLQRVPFEIYREAEKLYAPPGRIRFCRLSLYTKQFHTTNFETILSAYSNPRGASAPWETLWAPAKFWKESSAMLATIIQNPRFFLSIMQVAAYDFISMRASRHHFADLVQPGDILVSLGAAWGIPQYMKHIAQAKRRYGMKYAILIHDLIPIEYESFVEQQQAAQFRNWLEEAMCFADIVLTISKYSRDTLIKVARDAGWRLPRVEVVPPGYGLSDRLTIPTPTKARFPPRFVLCVSTIEIRKNHWLLVRVWRRLLERYGAEAVPMLIFAGKIGWSVDDLLAELRSNYHLDSKILLVSDLSDAELQECYRSCLFTIYPSLCEGWGLPVAESLAQGKLCAASNRTSIPEVGGNLADYFDPTNDDDAFAKIERLIFDTEYLKTREAQLRAKYRPQTWADCVHALIGKLDQSVPINFRTASPPSN
jgi:glycosyltransferase involved in cell wall biosynthesis